jgi:hypothetical protein
MGERRSSAREPVATIRRRAESMFGRARLCVPRELIIAGLLLLGAGGCSSMTPSQLSQLRDNWRHLTDAYLAA